MTLRERAQLWHTQAALADMRPVWWRRTVIRVLLGIRYDRRLKIYPGDINAT
jgi:hypothetical protein